MKVYDAHAEYTSVHRRKRPSAATVHIPVWHADLFTVIQMRTNQAGRNRTKAEFPCVWFPDILLVTLSSCRRYRANYRAVCAVFAIAAHGACSTLSMFRSCYQHTAQTSPMLTRHMKSQRPLFTVHLLSMCGTPYAVRSKKQGPLSSCSTTQLTVSSSLVCSS